MRTQPLPSGPGRTQPLRVGQNGAPAPGHRARDVVLLCNPRAGGRWRVLAEVLDSEEARAVRRIVTDEIDDVREAIGGLGQRVKLVCIYGGDGTIYRVLGELLRRDDRVPPYLALLGGGTMNVTSRWCGMSGSPAENFRRVMRAFANGTLLWREVPVLSISQGARTSFGFTFGLGPLVRILEAWERGDKGQLEALAVGLRAASAAVSGLPRSMLPLLKEAEARIVVDGRELPFSRFAVAMANVTGVVNPFVEPFVGDRSRDTLHFLAYAVSVRELAMVLPLLCRGRLPIDPASLLRQVSTWRQIVLSLAGKGDLPVDPRYVNHPAREVILHTPERRCTIDGEILPLADAPVELRLGPAVRLATLPARRVRAP